MTEISVNTDNQAGVIQLDSNLNISDAATLREILRCYADTAHDVTLDGSQVESIDTISLQLLLAFIRQLEGNECVITWHEPSDVICNIAQLLALDTELGLTEFPN